MNLNMPGLPVHHQLPEFTQTHAHWVGYVIQPSHPLSSPSPLVPSLSQHQGLFQWVNSLHEMAKILEFQLQHQSLQWTLRTYSFRMDWLDLLAASLGIIKSSSSFPILDKLGIKTTFWMLHRALFRIWTAESHEVSETEKKRHFIFKKFIYFNRRLITLLHCISFAIHWLESAMGVHVFPILNPLPPLSPSHPLRSSQCTSPERPVSCLEPGLAI